MDFLFFNIPDLDAAVYLDRLGFHSWAQKVSDRAVRRLKVTLPAMAEAAFNAADSLRVLNEAVENMRREFLKLRGPTPAK